MPLLQTADNPAPAWDFVYDEVPLEMAVSHPEISERNETTIKTRLLQIMAAADAPACDHTHLMRLFRETLANIGVLKSGKLGTASLDAD